MRKKIVGMFLASFMVLSFAGSVLGAETAIDSAPSYLIDEYGNKVVVDGIDLGVAPFQPEPGDRFYDQSMDLSMQHIMALSRNSSSFHSPFFNSSVVIGGTANPTRFHLPGSNRLTVSPVWQGVANNGWGSVDLAYQLRNTNGAIVDNFTRFGSGWVSAGWLGGNFDGTFTMSIANRSSSAAEVHGSLSW